MLPDAGPVQDLAGFGRIGEPFLQGIDYHVTALKVLVGNFMMVIGFFPGKPEHLGMEYMVYDFM